MKVVYDNADYGFARRPTIDRATLRAVIDEAARLDLPVVVHVGTWEDVRDAVEAGAAAVTHTPAGEMPVDLPGLLADRGVFHIPTLVAQIELARLVDDPAGLDDPLLRAVVSHEVLDSYRGPPPESGPLAGWLARERAETANYLDSVRRLADAGVPMLSGTDAGNPAAFHGYSVHRELELLVEAGLSTWDALAASTTNARRFLGRNWGMDVGAEATFLLLDGSPIEDIGNTRRIHAVVQRGSVTTRTDAPNRP